MAQTTIDFREPSGLALEDAIPFVLDGAWTKVAEIARAHLRAQRDEADGREHTA